ncbi:MAG: hypothetical protein AB2551_06195 [Candidatus Thiodiazotropha sp.]
MLNYLFEKSQERKQLKVALSQYGLGLTDLDPQDLKLILAVVHRLITMVSKKYGQPPATVLHHVITPVAWAIAYCLLGRSKIVQIDPGFLDVIDEVETELLLYLSGDSGSGQSIYAEVFRILLESTACHPQVLAILRNLNYLGHIENRQSSWAG